MSFMARTLSATSSGGGGGFTPVTNAYTTPGAFTEIVPTGATQLVAEVGGPGGGGGRAHGFSGGGGGSGGLSRKTLALTPANWGQTLNVSIMAGGAGAITNGGDGGSPSACTVANGTLSIAVAMTSNGGTGGRGSGPNGTGGAAFGGDVNTSGNPGAIGTGGAAIIGVNISSGAGGDGGEDGNASSGGNGAAAFAYT